jgi:hypothetical protein
MRSVVLNRILNKPLFHLLLIAILGLLVYSNTFDVPFHYDDAIFIVKNPLIKDFGYFTEPSNAERVRLSEGVKRFFRTRRVGYLTFWASYRLGELDVMGYHAFSLALHIANALFVYLIVTLTFRTPLLEKSRFKGRSHLIALFSGLLFVAHPLQTESVTYIMRRVELLAAMFYLASTAAYIGSRLSDGRAKYGLYALALVSAVLGMKTKENVFTLPIAIGLYEFMFFRGGIRKRSLLIVPLLLTMLIIPLEYIDMEKAGSFGATLESATRYPDAPPRLDYLYTQFNVVVSYISLLLFPVGQSVDHDQQVFHSFFETPVFTSFLLLVFVFCIGVYVLRRSGITDNALRLVSFGMFWFFIALSVESSVLPIGETIVEYRTYLPTTGAFIALGAGVFLIIERIINKPTQRAAIVLLAILTLVLSTATYARNTVWNSEISLWEDVVRKSPNKARGHNNLGDAYQAEGQIDTAMEHFKIAIKLRPDHAIAHYNLGLIYIGRGMANKALREFETSLQIEPSNRNAERFLNYTRQMLKGPAGKDGISAGPPAFRQ